jgi:hypothetical protein
MNETQATNLVDSGNVASVTSGLASKHSGAASPQVKKRGRHKADCECDGCKARKASLANDSAQGQADNAGDSYTPLDGQVFGQAVKAVVSAVDRAIGFRIFKLARATGADEAVAQELVSTSCMTVAELESVCNLSTVIAQKYAILGRYAPEMLLGCITVGYGARCYMTLHKLSEMRAEQIALARKQKAPDATESRPA